MSQGIPDTLYSKVRNEILRLIIDRNIQPNELLPSEGEIAELCGVSKMTSKLALNLLAEEKIIYRIPRRGSFLMDIDLDKVRNLVSQTNTSKISNKNKFIALILPKLDLYTGSIIKETERICSEQGIQLVVKFTEGISENEGQILSAVSKMPEIIGIILFPCDNSVCSMNLLQLKMESYPIVIIDRFFKEIEFDSVYHSHFQGAKDAIRFLIGKGHSKIGFLSDDVLNITSREERYLGYMNAMMEYNKRVKNEYIQIGKDFLTNDKLQEYLSKNPEMTAVFCADDYIAIKLHYAAEKLGKQIPADLSIVGFTDNQILEYLPFGMSSVRQPIAELCVKAFEILLNKISNKQAPLKTYIVETMVIDRSSVAELP